MQLVKVLSPVVQDVPALSSDSQNLSPTGLHLQTMWLLNFGNREWTVA